MKKTLLMVTLLIGAISYGAAGLNLKFNTDGKLHEEKLLNRIIVSEDTELEIKKIGEGKYKIKYFPQESDTKEYVSKATLKKNTICSENSCIGYDTKLKKAVFLDKDDMRIIYPEW